MLSNLLNIPHDKRRGEREWKKKQLTTYPHTLAAVRSTCGARLPSTPPSSPPGGGSLCCSKTTRNRRCQTWNPCGGRTEENPGPCRVPGRILDRILEGNNKKKTFIDEQIQPTSKQSEFIASRRKGLCLLLPHDQNCLRPFVGNRTQLDRPDSSVLVSNLQGGCKRLLQ